MILTDRGTYIKYEADEKGNPNLVIVNEGDNNLKNFYSIIATNPKHCKNVNYTEAKKFINWLTSDDTLSFISGFKLLYKPLFVVDAKTRKD